MIDCFDGLPVSWTMGTAPEKHPPPFCCRLQLCPHSACAAFSVSSMALNTVAPSLIRSLALLQSNLRHLNRLMGKKKVVSLTRQPWLTIMNILNFCCNGVSGESWFAGEVNQCYTYMQWVMLVLLPEMAGKF
jgi:hypothetical protein